MPFVTPCPRVYTGVSDLLLLNTIQQNNGTLLQILGYKKKTDGLNLSGSSHLLALLNQGVMILVALCRGQEA